MKKISLYMFSLLVLAGFSACDEDYTGLGQSPVQSPGGI